MPRGIDRRRFMGGAAGATAASMLVNSAPPARGGQEDQPLRLGVVGIAGYGAFHGFAQAIHSYENVQYAVSCDVDMRKVQRVYDLWDERAQEWAASEDEGQRKAAAEHYIPLAEKKPPLYADFRRMLDEAGDQIDAVVIATPDHTHAVIAAAALRAGKPVLVEKPLTISAHEARALHQLAKQHDLPTQMNNHGAASPGFRRGIEILREGVIGQVQEVHVFFSRGGRNFQLPPQGTREVPPELDWNLWLAQLKWRDYHPEWINRIGWRESSIGELGNFGPHSANMAFMALNVKDLWKGGEDQPPIRVQAECDDVNQLSYPRWERIRWDVPARGELPPGRITWHHGHPPQYAPGSRQMLEGILRDHGASDEELKDLLPHAGCLILGDRGLLATTSHNTTVALLPKERFDHVEQRRPLNMATSPGHYREWIDACRGGPTPWSNFQYAAPFAEFLNAGSLSTRFPGETLEFDPVGGRITNHPRAAEFLEYEYREGWTI
jgi:hypothetical protein